MREMTTLTLPRRQMLKLSGAGLITLAAPATIASAQTEKLTVFSWETYHQADWIKEWTEKTGIQVDVVLAGSVDEMWSRMASGAIEPDIIILDTGDFGRYAKTKLIAPLDIARIANAARVAPGFNYESRNSVDGALYGVPYNWGVQPMMYARSAGEEGMDSWNAMWDKRFVGKVSIFDDAYACIPLVAMKVGANDPYHLTEAEFADVALALRDLRPQVVSIARGPSDQAATFAAGEALVGYCAFVSEVFDLNADGQNRFAYSFPKEGALGWMNHASITPRGDREASYQFINDILSLEWQARFIRETQSNGVLTSDEALGAGLTTEELGRTTLLDQDKPGFWETLSVFSEPEDIERRVQLWNDFKAGLI